MSFESDEKKKKHYSKKHFYAYHAEGESHEKTDSDYYEEYYTQPQGARQARRQNREGQGKNRYNVF